MSHLLLLFFKQTLSTNICSSFMEELTNSGVDWSKPEKIHVKEDPAARSRSKINLQTGRNPELKMCCCSILYSWVMLQEFIILSWVLQWLCQRKLSVGATPGPGQILNKQQEALGLIQKGKGRLTPTGTNRAGQHLVSCTDAFPLSQRNSKNGVDREHHD